MIKNLWNKTPRYLKSKYFLTGFAFVFWMLFFDENNFISQMRLQSELNQYEEDKDYYKEEIRKTKSDLNELLTNEKNLEKFAREKYLMKKTNEDVFVIVND